MLTKTTIASGLLVLIGLTAPSAAIATTPGPGGTCNSTGCEGTINLPGTPGSTNPGNPGSTNPGSTNTGTGGGDDGDADASYQALPPFSGTPAECTASGGTYSPTGGGGPSMGGAMPVCLPGGGTGGPPTVTPQQVAQMARGQIAITKPRIKTAPCTDAGCMGAVGVPVWLWVDGGLPTRSATASAGGLTVTVTARMSSVTWNLGDGTTIRCGAGTPYSRDLGWAESPDCGHKYAKSSSSAAGGKYAITANATWTVNFTGDFVNTQTIQTSRAVNVAVGEYQAVVS